MTVTVHTKPVADLTAEEVRRFKRLTMRDGLMSHELSISWNYAPYGAEVYWIEEGGMLVAWALLFYTAPYERGVYFYVRRTHRRQGYGKKLATTIRAAHPRMRIRSYPWDKTSSKFFQQFPTFKTARGYRLE